MICCNMRKNERRQIKVAPLKKQFNLNKSNNNAFEIGITTDFERKLHVFAVLRTERSRCKY